MTPSSFTFRDFYTPLYEVIKIFMKRRIKIMEKMNKIVWWLGVAGLLTASFAWGWSYDDVVGNKKN